MALAHRVVAPLWPAPVGVISGPSFAEEVARGLPTAVTVAATDALAADEVAQRLRGETLRAYVSDDLTGVEVGGAVKNVLAIAAGASDGLSFGHNARAALITRGLATGRRPPRWAAARNSDVSRGPGYLVLTTPELSRTAASGLRWPKGNRCPRS